MKRPCVAVVDDEPGVRKGLSRLLRTAEFEAELLAALERKQGTVIEVMLDPEVITTRGTLSAIRANALKK